ncbi:hypothetical protein [Aquimarina litoralis]|uniref:hypothetical protein n=1 Tax=Aquimarina litoralis TaxID=584605 RepID=UPI0031D170C8
MKKNKLIDILFYISFAIVVIVAGFFDKKYLAFALPLMIISIGISYVKNIEKVNIWYIISLLSMIVCDILIYSDFVGNFSIICLLTACYFLMCSLAFRKYVDFKAITKNTFWSIPLVVSAALIVYLIVSIFNLLVDMVKDAILEVVICLFFSTAHILLSYMIYKRDTYKEAYKLIVVSCLCIFIVSLLPINEMFYSNNIFTVLVNIAHVLSLYLFMQFLIKTHPEKDIKEKTKKYL